MSKPRSRTDRRARERDARKLARDRQRLFLLSPGGAAAHPIALPSTSVVEVRARALPCPLCDGALTVDDHTAERVEGRILRVAHVTCRRCGVGQRIYFAIEVTAPS